MATMTSFRAAENSKRPLESSRLSGDTGEGMVGIPEAAFIRTLKGIMSSAEYWNSSGIFVSYVRIADAAVISHCLDADRNSKVTIQAVVSANGLLGAVQ